MQAPRPTAGFAHAAPARPTMTRTARLAFALAITMVAGLFGGLGSASAGPSPAETATRVIVQATRDIGAAASAVVAQGGRVVDTIMPLGIVVADVADQAVAPLEADAATASVTEDVPLRVQSHDTAATEDAIAATTADAGDGDGDGVGIVLVDTGIAAHADLGDRVVAHYDLATGKRRGKKGPAALDPHGHGTFLAGIAAAAAPGAHLVSVRVADADGTTTLARVLHGLAIADVARTQHDAPVVVLALAGEPGEPTAGPDPLMITLEMLWARGSTVVVPSGNRGEEDVVTSPGQDPYLITAGAVDDAGAVPDWSGTGEPFGHTKPEVYAPGVLVRGPRVEGSTISELASGEDGDHHMRGSGTSMAAAHVAGQAAAILAEVPMLTPTQVKDRLMVQDETIDEDEAANVGLAPLPEATDADRANGRTTAPGQMRRTADGLQPAGWTWAGWTWAGWTWAGWTWAGHDATIDGDGWAGWTWADGEWAGWTWAGWTWAGWTWAGWTWADNEWAGWTWAGWTWAGWTWAAADWGA